MFNCQSLISELTKWFAPCQCSAMSTVSTH